MKSLLFAALIAAVPALAQAQGAAQRSECSRGAGLVEPPVGARPASYVWTELWPSNAACATYGMGDLQFPAAQAAKKAFDDASAVPCTACEGGKFHDSWVNHFIPGGGADQKMAALAKDAKLTWKGNRLHGEIALIGEHPIGRFPCRQYRWAMKDAAGKVVAERTSLQCRNDAGAWRSMY